MSAKKDFQQLRQELAAQGFEVRQLKNNHYAVYQDSVWVCGLPATPSDTRGLANQIAALRRAGFVWKGR
ncbi:hypothetical protein [Streptomyces sp. YIM S03343]